MTTKAPVLPSLRLARIPAEFRGPRLESRRYRDVIAMSSYISIGVRVLDSYPVTCCLSTFLSCSSSKAAVYFISHIARRGCNVPRTRTRVTSINLVARVVTFLHENGTSLRQQRLLATIHSDTRTMYDIEWPGKLGIVSRSSFRVS